MPKYIHVLAQQNRITDRFISSLEKLIAEKKEEARLNRVALARLTGAVRRNSAIVSQLNPPPKLGIQNPPPKIGVQDPPPKIGLQDPPPKIGRG